MQYVLSVRTVKQAGGPVVPPDADLRVLIDAARLVAPASKLSDVRSSDRAEAIALRDRLVALRNLLGSTDEIVFHDCQHDTGVTDCRAAKVVL